MSRNYQFDSYDDYEALFDPMSTDRQARRKRKPKAKHIAKKTLNTVIDEIADTDVAETGFNITYQPSQHEAGWLMQSLQSFFDQKHISDVLSVIKGGKEASVYRVEAHPNTGDEVYAAKVYRPRMFRSLSNDAMYREGRETLNAEGRALKKTDHRAMRALGKKTAYGLQIAHTSWLMFEFTTLQQLYRAGAAVPQPIAASDNAILMTYYGDGHMAAPTLSEVNLEPDEAESLFYEVLRNVDLLLQMGLIHGDLSAYNILYHDGEIVMIDFPQVASAVNNSQAHMILSRDIERICQYFDSQGIDCDPAAITDRLWKRYVAKDTQLIEADMSRWTDASDDEYDE